MAEDKDNNEGGKLFSLKLEPLRNELHRPYSPTDKHYVAALEIIAKQADEISRLKYKLKLFADLARKDGSILVYLTKEERVKLEEMCKQ